MPSSNTSRCARTKKSVDLKKFATTGRSVLLAAVQARPALQPSLQKRPCNEISQRKKTGRSKAVLPTEKSLQILRRADRHDQLQGREAPLPIRSRARQDHASPHLRRLLPASTP